MREGREESTEFELIVLEEDNPESPDVEEEEIILFEDEGAVETVSEDELIVLDDIEPEEEEDFLIELEDDVLEPIALVEEPEAMEDFEGLNRLDDNMFDFLSSISDGTVILDEEDEAPKEQEEVTREGIEKTPQESLEGLINFSSLRLKLLEQAIDSNISYNDSNSRELLYSVMGNNELPFLTANDQAKLLTMVEGYDTQAENSFDQVVDTVRNAFLSQRKLDKRQQLELDTYLRSVVTRYRSYLTRTLILSDIRKSSNRFVIKRFMDEPTKALELMREFQGTDKVSYVKWIRNHRDHTDFCCGNCDHENTSEDGFFKILIHEQGINRNEHLSLLPTNRICEECGHLNIMTFTEQQSLNTLFNEKYEDLLMDWQRSTRKLSNFGNVMSYKLPKQVMSRVKPELYLQEIKGEEVVSNQLTFDTSNLNRWYLETLDTLKLLRGRDVKNEGGFVLEESGTVTHDEKDLRNSMRDLVVLYCNMFRADFKLLKTGAISSLLNYLKENPVLMSKLSVESLYLKECFVMYRGYIGSDLSDEVKNDIYTMIAKELRIEFEPYVTEEGVDEKARDEFEARLLEELAKIEKELEIGLENYDIAVKSLDDLTTLYRYIEIQQKAMPDLAEFDSILINPIVVDWIDHVSDLMIINNLIDEILDFWRKLKMGKYKNDSLVEKSRSTKTMREKIVIMLEAYSKQMATEGYVTSDGNIMYNPKVALHEFLSVSYTDTTLLTEIYNLKASVENVDWFNFCYAVVKLHGNVTHPAKAFGLFKDMLDKYIGVATAFVEEIEKNTSGNQTIDYCVYHYGKLFTEQEILESSRELHGFMKPSYYLQREDDETFGHYLKRLRTSTFDNSDALFDDDVEKFRELYKYYPSIFGVFEFYRYYSNGRSKVRGQVIMNDVIYYSYFFGHKYMLRALGLINLPISREYDLPFGTKDKNDYRYEFMLGNLIYPSVDFNLIANGRDDEIRSVVDVVKEDVDLFKEQTKYFGKFGEDVIEHYSS